MYVIILTNVSESTYRIFFRFKWKCLVIIECLKWNFPGRRKSVPLFLNVTKWIATYNNWNAYHGGGIGIPGPDLILGRIKHWRRRAPSITGCRLRELVMYPQNASHRDQDIVTKAKVSPVYEIYTNHKSIAHNIALLFVSRSRCRCCPT